MQRCSQREQQTQSYHVSAKIRWLTNARPDRQGAQQDSQRGGAIDHPARYSSFPLLAYVVPCGAVAPRALLCKCCSIRLFKNGKRVITSLYVIALRIMPSTWHRVVTCQSATPGHVRGPLGFNSRQYRRACEENNLQETIRQLPNEIRRP